MKINLFRAIALLAIISFVAVGCGGKSRKKGSGPGAPGGPESVGVYDPNAGTSGELSARPGDFIGATPIPGLQAVYFAYDSAAINPSEQQKLQDVVDWMNSNSGPVLIEGHADERGTDEYNRALGERRALAIREYLISLGGDAGRLQTISYGESRPANPGHTPEAWASNRRAEFVSMR